MLVFVCADEHLHVECNKQKWKHTLPAESMCAKHENTNATKKKIEKEIVHLDIHGEVHS